MWPGLLRHYKDYLPVEPKTPIVTLAEGNTPFFRAEKLTKMLGGTEAWLKFEGANPTGSFKDRGMTMAVSRAKQDGAKVVICASTGNTSASAAAYAARAGLKCVVLIPEGAIAMGKLSQALMHGAQVVAVDGNFDQALRIVRTLCERHREITLVNSVNPYRIEGQKTGAFEIVDSLGDAPEYLAIPVGNAGNITAYWKGFREYRKAGVAKSLPKMLGFQAAGAAPIVQGDPVSKPETVATAIRIGNPASWKGALQAIQDSGGRIEAVPDEEIIGAYRFLAREEGIFVEPASATCVAGILRLAREGYFGAGEKVACILTGHGLKDPNLAIEVGGEPVRVPARIEEVERVVLG